MPRLALVYHLLLINIFQIKLFQLLCNKKVVDYWNCRGLSRVGLYSVSGTLILRKSAQASILTENHSEFLYCRERRRFWMDLFLF